MPQIKYYLNENYNKEEQWLQAVSINNIPEIKQLISEGVNINYQNLYDKFNALMLASINVSRDVLVLLLIQPNIKCDLKNMNNDTFLDILLRKNYSLDFIINEKLQETIINNNHNNIMLFVKHNLLHPDFKAKYPYITNMNQLGLL